MIVCTFQGTTTALDLCGATCGIQECANVGPCRLASVVLRALKIMQKQKASERKVSTRSPSGRVLVYSSGDEMYKWCPPKSATTCGVYS